ncbi:MAG: acylphosphatase [Chloroflexi bacterium OLB14]|nr:MAG: acylphosphatase [Chloroflexi bacterium OLB14]
MENNNPNEIIRVHIWVKGRVQKVGFRAHVEYQALQLGIFGWVRNFDHDCVETVGEGKRQSIARFIEIVKQGPSLARVDEAKIEYEEPTGELSGFHVKKAFYSI